MEKLVIDTCVFLHFFLGQEKQETVNTLLEHIEARRFFAQISILTITELISILSRKANDETVWKCLNYIFKHFVAIPVTPDIAIPAGFHKAKYAKTNKGFSYIDGIILSTAEITKSTLVTYDPDFKTISEVKVITPEDLL